MLRSCRLPFLSPLATPTNLTPLPELLVKELQSKGLSVGLESRLRKNLHRFSLHQCALILNGLSRPSPIDPTLSPRRLAHLISSKLVPAISSLTLRELALVIHAIGKLGLRNEIFFTESLSLVDRKLKTTNPHTMKTISATALICRTITKLNLIGDGSLIRSVIFEHIPKWLELNLVNEIDSITLLPVVLDFGDSTTTTMIQHLLSLIESPAIKVSALFLLSKSNRGSDLYPPVWWTEIDEKFSSLTQVKQIQAFQALSVLYPLADRLLVTRWFTTITQSRIDEKNLLVLVLSSITKFAEVLSEQIMVDFVSQIIDDSTIVESLSSDSSKELAILLNCMASIRMEIPKNLRRSILGMLKPVGEDKSHSFSLIVSSFARLGETELMYSFLTININSREKILRDMTKQSRDVSLFAIASVWDIDRSNCILKEWIDALLESQPFGGDGSRESTSQIRIVDVILDRRRDLDNENFFSKNFQYPNIVSQFHSQVADTISRFHPIDFEINSIDTTTGYEIDIRL